MLEIKNLTIQYTDKTVAVKKLSLFVKKGEVLAIVGESGSGKSTILRATLGLFSNNGKIIEGDIIYNDKSLKNKSLKEWKKLRGTEITMISQDTGGVLNPVRKIGSQYIEYIKAHEKISTHEAEKKAILLLKKVHLHNPRNVMESYPHQLSGGMKQRVGIAMALTFNPKIILADEPTSALDVNIQAEIVRELMELRDELETTMIIVTHNIGVAAYMADKILVMKDGEVVEQGTREEIIKNPKNDYTKQLLTAVPKMDGERLV